MGILTLDQAHCADDFETEGAGRFDGIDRRSSRGADIVDDDDRRARLAEALDALSGSVLLL